MIIIFQTLRESRRAVRDPITCVEPCGNRGRSFTLTGTSLTIGKRECQWNGVFRGVATSSVRKSMSMSAVRRGMRSIRSPEIVQYVAKIANFRKLRDVVNCNEWLRNPPEQYQRRLRVMSNAMAAQQDSRRRRLGGL